MSRFALVVLVAAACGGKSGHPPPGGAAGAAPAPASLDGTWVDDTYTLTFAGPSYTLRQRLPCARLPCASGQIRTGTWTRDGSALHLAATYDLSFADGGETMVLVPVAVAADGQPTLRLRHLVLPALAGTRWDAGDGHTLELAEHDFVRREPCDGCEQPTQETRGTWTVEEGQLALEWDGGNEAFDVRVEDGVLVLIGSTETTRYQPAP